MIASGTKLASVLAANVRAVVGYVRVSSRAQDHATQVSAIERVAAARGDHVQNWYGEKRSARMVDRPELVRLRTDARSGNISRLYVFRLDRLTRSGIRDTIELVDEFRSYGVELVSIADGFDLHGPAAEVVLAVLAWAAKMERQATAERIAAARERLAEEGRPWGRPRRMDDGLVRRALELRRAGRSIRQIAMALKVKRATLARALQKASRKPDEQVGALRHELRHENGCGAEPDPGVAR